MKVFILLSILILSGCTSTTVRIGSSLNNWYEVQDMFADIMDKHIGASRQNIISAKGFQQNIGAILDMSGSTVDICDISKLTPHKAPVKGIPTLSAKSDNATGIGLPLNWKNSGLGTASAGIKFGNETRFSYTELNSERLLNNDADKLISNINCYNKMKHLKTKAYQIVIGVITGKLKATSSNFHKSHANISIAETDILNIKYNPSGGYEIEEKKTVQQFLIVSFVTSTNFKHTVDFQKKRLNRMKYSEEIPILDENGKALDKIRIGEHPPKAIDEKLDLFRDQDKSFHGRTEEIKQPNEKALGYLTRHL